MRVLITWPPHVPSYFNAGHHLPTFTIAAYLRAQGHDVDALDAGALNFTWKEFADRVYQGRYDAVVVVNEYDVVEGVRRAADYARALLPDAMIVTVGRLSQQNPGFFRSLEFDAIVTSGDFEPGTAAALHAGRRPTGATGLPGVMVRDEDGWHDQSGPGIWLPSDEWRLPNVEEIPYLAYANLYHKDQNKFCGIPDRRELVVQVARGCPIGCSFCDVPPMQGLRERRLTVERTLNYVRDAFSRHPFEYVAFYAPTFTLDRRWVLELCTALGAEPRRYAWKCTTTLRHLDEELVRAMGEAGCVRISVGVETFEDPAAESLPRAKRHSSARFEQVAAWCDAAGIELNCFVIVGLPGSTPDGTRKTMGVIAAAGCRVRPTLYTPYERMRADMTERELSAFNRQTFVDPAEITDTGYAPGEFLRLLFDVDDYTTPATARIPVAATLWRAG